MTSPESVLALQRTIGNRGVVGLLRQACCESCEDGGPCDDLIGGDVERPLKSPRFRDFDRLQAIARGEDRMREGEHNELVQEVQQALIDVEVETKNHYDLGESGADGWYGAKTAAAVRKFKADEQLGSEQYGDVGPGTLRRLDMYHSGRRGGGLILPKPDHQTSTARVEVKAVPVGGIPGGATPWHLYIVHTDDNGRQTAYRGGPGTCSGGERWDHRPAIAVKTGPYDGRFVDWDPSAPTVTAAYGEKAKGKDACLHDRLMQIDSACMPYWPLGPNSNSTVRDLLHHCGLPEMRPETDTPGWDVPLPMS